MTQNRYVCIAWVLMIVVVVLGCIYTYLQAQRKTEQEGAIEYVHAMFGGYALNLELATSSEARSRGLSGRSTLPDGQGMLFVFSEDDYHAFWMPGMYFSIDIVWLDHTLHVVHIAEHVSPESYPKRFLSDTVSRYVLEVPSGWMNTHGLTVGSKLELDLQKLAR